MIETLNGGLKHNIMEAVQEQTWTPAHELKHVWGADAYVSGKG